MVATLERALERLDGESVVMDGVSWSTYVRLRREARSSRLRMTYDAGVLEIMSPSYFHETAAELVSDCIKIFARDRHIKHTYGGHTTFRRSDLKKGLEPDQCFWFKNAERVRGKKRLNLAKDPPPDLVIEVDISSSSKHRMNLYAALRVPEVWRYAESSFSMWRLSRGRTYGSATASIVLPEFPLEVVNGLVAQLDEKLLSELIDAFAHLTRGAK